MSGPYFGFEPAAAWEPYHPDRDGAWDAARVVHLHRRAGFGASWAQLQRDLTAGPEVSIQRVLEGESNGPDGRSATDFTELAAIMEEDALREPTLERVQLGWLFRIVFTPHPLAEKMTLAWHSHYATSNAKVRNPVRMLGQVATLRRLWRAPIRQLHAAMLRDPAMLAWLDGTDNTRERPNENLGREFLELFALGEGHYSEEDVRAVARALTGWQEDSTRTGVLFVASRHDDGPKTILGERGNWAQGDVVKIVCRQPAAALHIARRLYRTFICDTDDAPAPLLEPLAQAMRTEGDVDVRRGIEVVLRSRLFHSPACRGKRIASPVEYVAGPLRTCEAFAPPPDLADVEMYLGQMGQRLLYPPNVAGWPGGLSWLGGSTILARERFAASFAEPNAPHGTRHLQALASRHEWKTPAQACAATALLLLGVSSNVPSHSFDGRFIQSLLALPEAQVC